MPLPPSPYPWVCCSPTGTDWRHRGAVPPGYVTVPAQFAYSDSDTLSVTNGVVGPKLASVLRVEAALDKRAEINAHVQELIAQGFTYGGQTFSLSAEAQSNLHALKARAATLSWPLVLFNADDSASVSLADAAAGGAFYTAAMDAVDAARAAGRTRKAAIVTALADPDAAAGLATILAIDGAW